MDDLPICPEWWPLSLWRLHFTPLPYRKRWWVNYPPALDSILSSLQVHTASYMMHDQELAKQIRGAAVKNIIDMAGKMDQLHEDAGYEKQ